MENKIRKSLNVSLVLLDSTLSLSHFAFRPETISDLSALTAIEHLINCFYKILDSLKVDGSEFPDVAISRPVKQIYDLLKQHLSDIGSSTNFSDEVQAKAIAILDEIKAKEGSLSVNSVDTEQLGTCPLCP